MAIGSVVVNISARLNDLTSGLNRGAAQVERFGSRVAGVMAKARGAFAAVAGGLAVRSIANAFQETAENLDRIGKASDRFGLTVDEMMGLEHAASLSGVTIQELDTAMTRFARVMAGRGEKASVYDALLRVSDEMASQRDATKRVEMAYELFGRAGAKMVNVLGSGSQAMRIARRESELLNGQFGREAIAGVEAYNDAIERLRVSFRGLAQEAVVTASPGLAKIADMTRHAWTFLKNLPEGFDAATRAVGEQMIIDIQNRFAGANKSASDLDDTLESITDRIKDLSNPALLRGTQEAFAAINRQMRHAVPSIAQTAPIVKPTPPATRRTVVGPAYGNRDDKPYIHQRELDVMRRWLDRGKEFDEDTRRRLDRIWNNAERGRRPRAMAGDYDYIRRAAPPFNHNVFLKMVDLLDTIAKNSREALSKPTNQDYDYFIGSLMDQ